MSSGEGIGGEATHFFFFKQKNSDIFKIGGKYRQWNEVSESSLKRSWL
jgi:hypothetical protein